MGSIAVQPAPLEKLGALLTEARAERLMVTAERARPVLADRVVWNVNATAHGGGVAEMLQTLRWAASRTRSPTAGRGCCCRIPTICAVSGTG